MDTSSFCVTPPQVDIDEEILEDAHWRRS